LRFWNVSGLSVDWDVGKSVPDWRAEAEVKHIVRLSPVLWSDNDLGKWVEC
jgi:hypothetical protein